MASGARLARPVVAVVLVLLPVVVLALTPWHAQAFLLFLAVPPALLGFLRSVAAAWAAAALAGLAMLLGDVASPSVVAGVAVVVVACALVALASRTGAAALGTAAVVPLLLGVVAPPEIPGLPTDRLSASRVLLTTALVLGGGAWTALVAGALLPGFRHRAAHPETRDVALAYGATLVVAAGTATWAVMTWFPGTHAWWVLLTIVVVLQPTFEDTRSRAAARTLGTLAGALVAALLVALVPSARVEVLLGVVAALAAGVANLRRPYGQYTALLTLSLVLMTGGGSTALATGAERVLATVAGTAVVALVIALGHLLRRAVGRPAPSSQVRAASPQSGL